MSKSILTICLWTAVFLLSGARGWSDDMEDRLLDPDFSTSKSIFIDVKDVSLVNVLKIISQQSGLSFIAAQDVADKKITVYLNKIPLNQALPMVLDANDLTYEMQDETNVFFVKKKETTAKSLITRVYQLKYASVSTSQINSTLAISNSSVANSASSSASSTSASGSTSNTGSSASGSTSGSTGSTSSPGSSSGASTSPTIASGGLEEVLKDSLSPDGKVVEDMRTNSLIITDVPAQFDIIESTIAKLDVPVPQILIEVQMVEVSKATADQLGITYGATPLTFTGGSKISNWPFGAGSGSLAGSTSTSSSTSTTSAVTGWNAPGSGANLSAALNFLSSTTDTRILARPKILTLNNQKAQIEIATNQVINYTTTTNDTTSGSTENFTPVTAQTGVTLTVTPQANLLTREITLAVSPRDVIAIQSQVQPPAASGLGTSFDTQTRGADSILKLKDGQSMVIGGLMDNQDSSTVVKLPFLGDLPLIGAAFRSKNVQKNDRELIIFLTPHIIDDANQSALRDNSNASISPQAALDIQDADEHAREINDSLNNYEMKQN